MTLPRIVAVERLDGLAGDDPAALRSRRDLRRIHRLMGTRAIVLRALRDSDSRATQLPAAHRGETPLRVLELGAGDGSLMLGVARSLAATWPAVELTLLDRQASVDRTTIERYAALGWTATVTAIDALDWAAGAADARLPGGANGHWDLIVANLFLHHFEGEQLSDLLAAIAARSQRFFACEPRRAWPALVGSHLLGAIGANAVTREDAVLSVHAGFRGNELTRLWPAHGVEWRMHEDRAGLFGHSFRAERLGAR